MIRFKSIFRSSIGNILEWYDFGLFAIYSPLLSRLFFPAEDSKVALLATFSIFAVGFLCRPLGALLFGYLGDRSGRVKTLRLSILMISIPTLLLGLLPTYAQIGIIAPLLFTLIRIWQGISLGGEYSGNLIYLAETAPKKYRATITSLAGTGANFGILFAIIIGGMTSNIFTETVFKQWGWRLPYLLSGIICIFIYATRLQMEETPIFDQLKKNNQLAQNPIKTMFRKDLLYVLRTLGLVCMGSTFYYFSFIYIPVFLLEHEHLSLFKTTNLMAYYMAAMLIFVPCAGRLCDYLGRRKLLLFNAFLIILIVIPGFYLLKKHDLTTILVVMTIFTLASSLEQGATSVAVVENYPVRVRYTGLSLGYNMGTSIFGGTAPLVCEWLLIRTHNMLAPAIYVCLCAIVTGLVVFFFTKETKDINLG